MTLVKFQSPVTRRFASLFDEFFNDLPAMTQERNVYYPPVNIAETDDAYHLELSAPGLNKDDFQIEVDKGLLTISYEKKQESTTENYNVVRREFSYQNFKRTFTLDEKINTENIQAKYENGLLKILLPKKVEVKPEVKKINIQ